MIYFALDRAFRGLSNDILDPYERFILFVGFQFRKMWIFFLKTAVFPGGYGRIAVYKVIPIIKQLSGARAPQDVNARFICPQTGIE